MGTRFQSCLQSDADLRRDTERTTAGLGPTCQAAQASGIGSGRRLLALPIDLREVTDVASLGGLWATQIAEKCHYEARQGVIS